MYDAFVALDDDRAADIRVGRRAAANFSMGLGFMTDPNGDALKGLGALTALQDNASGFFQRILDTHGDAMACRAGCSACCHVALDVFEGEALRIVSWVRTLDGFERAALRKALEQAKAGGGTPGVDAAGKKRSPCVFLSGGLCAVYAARPVICRTQGAPLQLRKEDGKGNVTVSVDACPLNYRKEGTFPVAAEWLDLDRLTVLQVLAERQCAAAGNEPMPWKKSAEGRVSLGEVRRELLRLLA